MSAQTRQTKSDRVDGMVTLPTNWGFSSYGTVFLAQTNNETSILPAGGNMVTTFSLYSCVRYIAMSGKGLGGIPKELEVVPYIAQSVRKV